jgi:hypothetical protein
VLPCKTPHDDNTNSARLSWHNVVDQLNKKRTIAMAFPSENTASQVAFRDLLYYQGRATHRESFVFRNRKLI